MRLGKHKRGLISRNSTPEDLINWTKKTGAFDLKGLPPGAYTIEAWQEYYGAQDQRVTLGPNQTKSISFVFKPKAAR